MNRATGQRTEKSFPYSVCPYQYSVVSCKVFPVVIAAHIFATKLVGQRIERRR